MTYSSNRLVSVTTSNVYRESSKTSEGSGTGELKAERKVRTIHVMGNSVVIQEKRLTEKTEKIRQLQEEIEQVKQDRHLLMKCEATCANQTQMA